MRLFLIVYSNKTTYKLLNTSGTVVPPGRRLPSGRAPPGLGGGDLETWKSRGDPAENAVAVTTRVRRLRLVTATTKKQPVTVVRYFARGGDSKNRYLNGQTTQKYLRWSEGQTSLSAT